MQDRAHEEQLQSSIVMALLYSDIFSYPLTTDEIFRRLSTNHTSVSEVEQELCAMKDSGIVYQFENYFAIRNDQTLAERRNNGNKLAKRILPRAVARGHLLHAFPFIRSVMISGSLAKNFMDEDSDVDYFVITEPGRLWVARFFVALFKRIFLFNSRKRFCVNYYVDYLNLEIQERNIFTAIELATLIPVTGGAYYDQLMKGNDWIEKYFPNYSVMTAASAPVRNSIFKRTAEALIAPFGDWLDTLVFRMAFNRYRKLYGHLFSKEDFDIAFKSKKGISKNHDRHFQKHITELFRNKVEKFTEDHPKFAAV
jgi:hypothetical protein